MRATMRRLHLVTPILLITPMGGAVSNTSRRSKSAAGAPSIGGKTAGGFRKARWARRGKAKSGGFRVIYFFVAEPGQIYMAAIYAKSRMENLSAADRNVLAKLASRVKRATKGGR
jgi:hypothetical protein